MLFLSNKCGLHEVVASQKTFQLILLALRFGGSSE